MSEYSISQLNDVISTRAYRLLKKLEKDRRYRPLCQSDELHALSALKLIEPELEGTGPPWFESDETGRYRITDSGILYVMNRHDRFKSVILNRILSIAGLLIALGALIVAILAL